MMSFFDPDIVYEDGTTYRGNKYKQIIEEQVIISYLSQSISLFDTDVLSPYDRKLVLETIQSIKEEEKKTIDETFNKTKK